MTVLIDVNDLIKRAQETQSIEKAICECQTVKLTYCAECVNWCMHNRDLGRCAVTSRYTNGGDYCSHAEEA